MQQYSTTRDLARGDDRCAGCGPARQVVVPQWLLDLAVRTCLTTEELLALSPQALADLEVAVDTNDWRAGGAR